MVRAMTETLSLEEFEALARDCLTRAGVAPEAARAVARDVALAEAMGERSCGLDALLRDLRLLRYGRLAPDVIPHVMQTAPAVLHIDARHGFAAAAVDAGRQAFAEMAQVNGVALMRLENASPPGLLAGATETLASEGLLVLWVDDAGTARVASPSAPCPMPVAGMPTSALLTLLGVAEDDSPARDDSPVGAPVQSRAWLAAADAERTGAHHLLTRGPAIAADHETGPLTFPSELLAQLITA